MTDNDKRWLPSDCILFRTGFDGHEPKPQARAQWDDSAWIRTTLALNTWYPEVQGGFYYNRNLIGLIQESLQNIEIRLIHSDYRREYGEGIEPVEPFCSLEKDEDYCLVQGENTGYGFLRIWDYWILGHALGEYYSENFIVDIVSPHQSFAEQLRITLKQKCSEYGVRLEEVAQVSQTPVKLNSGWWDKVKGKL